MVEKSRINPIIRLIPGCFWTNEKIMSEMGRINVPDMAFQLAPNDFQWLKLWAT